MDIDTTRPLSAAGPPSEYPGWPVPGGGPSGVELLGFARALCGASNHADFRRRFMAGFARLFDFPMCGLYIVDPWTGRSRCEVSKGVSNQFLARYERGGRELNWLQGHLETTRRAVYNMAFMPMAEWLENPLYTGLKYLHDIRHEVQAPVVNRDGMIGVLHLGTNDPDRGITPYEVHLTEALGGVIGTAIEGIDHRISLERERDQAVVALDRTGTAVVITDPADPEPRPNAAARLLLADLLDPEPVLHRVITPPGPHRGFSRHIDVDLVGGGTGVLHGYSDHAGAEDTVITVLELQRDQAEISPETLAALTPRERQIALLVIDGHSDRQIAARLYLSHHTISQYVKRIYRKLDVPSRVALTRLLITTRESRARG